MGTASLNPFAYVLRKLTLGLKDLNELRFATDGR
jgi:hypothetical protein